MMCRNAQVEWASVDTKWVQSFLWLVQGKFSLGKPRFPKELRLTTWPKSQFSMPMISIAHSIALDVSYLLICSLLPCSSLRELERASKLLLWVQAIFTWSSKKFLQVLKILGFLTFHFLTSLNSLCSRTDSWQSRRNKHAESIGDVVGSWMSTPTAATASANPKICFQTQVSKILPAPIFLHSVFELITTSTLNSNHASIDASTQMLMSNTQNNRAYEGVGKENRLRWKKTQNWIPKKTNLLVSEIKTQNFSIDTLIKSPSLELI